MMREYADICRICGHVWGVSVSGPSCAACGNNKAAAVSGLCSLASAVGDSPTDEDSNATDGDSNDKAEPPATAPQHPQPQSEGSMNSKKGISISESLQEIDGPISGDIRNAIVVLGELVSQLPGNHLSNAGRQAVLALADCCIRVHGMEQYGHDAAAVADRRREARND